MPNLLDDFKAAMKSFGKNEDAREQFLILAMPFLIQHEEDVDGERRGDIYVDYVRTCHPHDNEKLNAAMAHASAWGPYTNARQFSPRCEKCQGVIVENEPRSERTCTSCGSSETVFVPVLSFADEQSLRKPCTYSYKRISHFSEFLSALQGRETVTVPEEVCESVRREIKKQRLDNDKIDHRSMRGILKKLGLNAYYEHATQILSTVTGRRPPRLSPALENRLRAMFAECQEPFALYAPEGRSNFCSYPYITYKFAELLCEDWLLPHISLLKSSEKLRAQDDIWRKITAHLRWEFIPTI